jgi:hypothetical protein
MVRQSWRREVAASTGAGVVLTKGQRGSARASRAKGITAAIAAGTLIAGVVAGASPALADTNIRMPSNGYALQVPNTTLVVDVLNGATQAGSAVAFWNQGSPAQPNQIWDFVPATETPGQKITDGWGYLQGRHSGLCLTIENPAAGVDPANVTIKSCLRERDGASESSRAAQTWQTTSGPDNTFLIKSAVVTSTGASYYLGRNVQNCEASSVKAGTPLLARVGTSGCTSWKVPQVSTVPGVLSSTNPYRPVLPLTVSDVIGNPTNILPWGSGGNVGYSITLPGANPGWGTPLRTAQTNGASAQTWYFEYAKTVFLPERVGKMTLAVPAYRIKNINPSTGAVLCLEAEGAAPRAGAAVDAYGCDPNYKAQPNQLWLVADPNIHWDLAFSIAGWNNSKNELSPAVSRVDGTENTTLRKGAVLVNLGSLPTNLRIADAAVLAAPDQISGQNSSLRLATQDEWPASNKTWAIRDLNPAPTGSQEQQQPEKVQCTGFACLLELNLVR